MEGTASASAASHIGRDDFLIIIVVGSKYAREGGNLRISALFSGKCPSPPISHFPEANSGQAYRVSEHTPHAKLVGLVLICSVLWGSAFPSIKYVYGIWEMDFAATYLFAGVRFTVAGFLIFLVLAKSKPFERLKKANFRLLAALTLLQTVGQYTFFYWAMSVSSGALGALLVSAGSLWWVILSPIFLKSPIPTGKQIAILLMCSAGIILAMSRPGAGSGDPLLGGVLFLLSSLSGVLGIIFLQPLSKTIDVPTATGFSLFAGGIILTVIGLPAIDQISQFTDLRVAGMTAYLTFVSAAAFTLWNSLSRKYPVNILAGYRFLIPLSGVILSALFIPGEKIGAGIYAGGSIVIVGIFLLAKLSPTPTSPVR